MTSRSEPANFWSRRRAAVEAEAVAEVEQQRATEVAELQSAQAEKSDEEILTELELPDPDALQPGDDIAGFMQAAVPERLRRRALRQLWRLNPALANLDQLIDYGEDYTDAATVIENMQTAYQVGRGMTKHVIAMAEEAEAEAQEHPAADPEVPEEQLATLAPPEPEQDPPLDLSDAAADPVYEEAEEPLAPVRPRHMRFRFASTTDPVQMQENA